MAYAERLGRRIAYDVAGPADGPTLVFANSIGTAQAMWDGVVAALGPTVRAIRFDARGHGTSDPEGAAATIDDLADDALAAMDAAGAGRALFVGLSLGGMVGQALALRAPERLSGLVLCATGAALQPASAWEERARTALTAGMEPFVALSLDRWFTPAFREAEPAAVAACAAMLRGTDAASYAACCRIIRDTDLRERLAEISLPALLIAGRDDPATPPSLLDEIATRLGGPSERVDVAPAAHMLAVERPAETAALIARFTRSIAGA